MYTKMYTKICIQHVYKYTYNLSDAGMHLYKSICPYYIGMLPFTHVHNYVSLDRGIDR